jgi:SAM-dependent methyltransferase
MPESTEFAGLPREVDTSRPHAARMYDYFLGGKNHFAADRETADRVIGTGLPTTNSVHEVAQGIAPSSRVVYVDNDPLVLIHAQALLTSSAEGRTAYIHADLRSPGEILSSPVVRSVLDFSQPVALILAAVLHFIADDDRPAEIVATLRDALAPGSYLVASHISAEHNETGSAAGQRAYRSGGVPMHPRESGSFADIVFTGMSLVPPGLVLVSEWRRNEGGPPPPASEVNCYGGVARTVTATR